MLKALRHKEGSVFANVLSRYWWLTALRGLIWVGFGIFAFVQPVISLVTLTLVFGAVFLVDGVIGLIAGLGGGKEQEDRWLLVLTGVAGVVVGVLTFLNPAMTGLVLLFYVALWAIATGLLEILGAIRLRKEIRGELWLIIAGVLSVAFGVFILARPGTGALAILWIIACYAIILGIAIIALAFRARSFGRQFANAGAW
jgi:uncharacterized membrane protein HdeD (DUF308 family)